DPARGWFPHFVGHADEIGSGDGQGANLNVPIEPGEGDEAWLGGVDTLVEFAQSAGVTGVVVSLGVDAAISDPESPLQITEAGFAKAGERVASLALPTVFIQEGGYDLATLGALVRATLDGFDDGRGF
ncbi:MAG: histone deacetylase family protein, partial [Acidimicrobiia bacterium]|nr:histone deacetylase family protein [Acidimicrobiia bacterium]